MTSEAVTARASNTGRTERRRVRVRQRLITAAAQLMAGSGPANVTISAITEQADVGAGTFYNYFQSRDEIVEAVIESTVETLGQRLDALTWGMPDAAEIYSFSLRHLMRTAVTDPLWGWLVVRLGIAHEQLITTLGPRARRDLMIGVGSGRFQIPDVDVATALTFGALLSAIRAHLNGDRKSDPSQVFAEFLLRMVGVPTEEAFEIARRPLPALPSLEEAHARLGLGTAE
jgi:AcrR family transcriptional regulator